MKSQATILASLVAVPFSSADPTYRSRPDLSPPSLNITVPASDLVEPGYLFVAPYVPASRDGTPMPAPYIYDTTGELIWSGWGYFGSDTAASFEPATWSGHGDVLLGFEGRMNFNHGYAHGHYKILNSQYQTIQEVRTGGHYVADMHEFNLIDESTALLGSYTPRQIDLTPFGGDENQTWVLEYILQEVDIETNDVLFEWHSLAHTSPGESTFSIGDNGDPAYNISTAWDCLHINAIDKGTDGHYLASGRSTSTIYKINSTDGSIIWRLGGNSSNFTLGTGVEFALQHHVRYVAGAVQDNSGATISLFDNAATTAPGGSSGKILSLDYTNMTATLKQAFTPPEVIHAVSQGSAQLLPGGGALVNWGSADQVTEFSADGDVLFHVFLESGTAQSDGNTQNYRAFRGNWTGYSQESLAVFAQLQEDGGANTTSVWVSWNGDTRTVDWRFQWNNRETGAANSNNVQRTGFETRFDVPSDTPITELSVEALDASGNVLTSSGTIKVKRS